MQGERSLSPSSAQLEPRGGLDSIQQLVPHQLLVAELREFEQVHAGAGGGQALQVSAAVVDAEDRVKLLEAQQWRSGAAGDKLQQLALFLICEAFNNLPKDLDDWVSGRVPA